MEKYFFIHQYPPVQFLYAQEFHCHQVLLQEPAADIFLNHFFTPAHGKPTPQRPATLQTEDSYQEPVCNMKEPL